MDIYQQNSVDIQEIQQEYSLEYKYTPQKHFEKLENYNSTASPFLKFCEKFITQLNCYNIEINLRQYQLLIKNYIIEHKDDSIFSQNSQNSSILSPKTQKSIIISQSPLDNLQISSPKQKENSIIIQQLSQDQNQHKNFQFHLQAALMELEKILKIIQFPSQIKQKSFIEGTSYQSNIEQVLKTLSNCIESYKNYLQSSIIICLQDLQTFYSKLKEKISNSQDNNDSQNFQFQQQQQQQQQQIISNFNYPVQLECLVTIPIYGYFLAAIDVFDKLKKPDSDLIHKLKSIGYNVQRIKPEQIKNYQRYLLLYISEIFLLDISIEPAMVIEVEELHSNQSQQTPLKNQQEDLTQSDKKKLQKCFYLVSFHREFDNKVTYPLSEFSLKSDENDNFSIIHEKNQNLQIDFESILINIIAALYTFPLESSIPHYIVSENGELVRQFQIIQSEGEGQHYGMKNPLFFFKQIINQCILTEEDFRKKLIGRNYLSLYFQAQEYLQLSDETQFYYDNGTYSNSLKLNSKQMKGFFDKLRKYNNIFEWIKEVVLPVNSYFSIGQLIQKLQPAVKDFYSNINHISTITEYIDFVKKLQIEQFLMKILTKKAMQKYIDTLKNYDDFSKSSSSSSFSSLSLANTQTKLTNFSDIMSTFIKKIDLYDVSTVLNRSILKQYASQNYFFIKDNSEKNNLFEDSQFNHTWKDPNIWVESIKFAHNQVEENKECLYDVFIELAAIEISKCDLYKHFQKKAFYLLKNTKQDQQTINRFKKFIKLSNFLQGDKAYPEYQTLLEHCLEQKKYLLAKILVDKGEGKHLQQDTFIRYFSHQEDPQVEIIKKYIIEKLKPYHIQSYNHFEWEKMWQQTFKSVDLQQPLLIDQALLVYNEEYGMKQISREVWSKCFSIKSETESEQYKSQLNIQLNPFKSYEIDKCYLINNQEIKNNYYFETHGHETKIRRNLAIADLDQMTAICLEEQPTYPGITYAIDDFYHNIGCQGRQKRIICTINQINYHASHYYKDATLLSQKYKDCQLDFEAELDEEMLSERILTTFLLYPQHDGMEDEIIEKNQITQKYRLINIGESQCFQQGIIKENNEHFINVKCFLFCLNFMNKPINNAVYDKFLQMNPYQVIKQWLYSLSSFCQLNLERNQKYEDIMIQLNQNLQNKQNHTFVHLSETPKLHQTFSHAKSNNKIHQNIIVPFRKKQILELYIRFQKLVRTLKEFDKNRSKLTHQLLFEKIDPRLSSYYSEVVNLAGSSVAMRYKRICDRLYKDHFILKTIQTFQFNFLILKEEEDQNMQEIISKLEFLGPFEALSKLKKYHKVYPSDVLTQGEKSYLNQIKSAKQMTYFLQNLDYQNQDQDHHKEFIKLIQQKMQNLKEEKQELVNQLFFDNISSLTIQQLTQFQMLNRITVLSLQKCYKLTDHDIITISQKFEFLQYLDISYNEKITQINSGNAFKYLTSTSLKFNSLKTLISTHMKKLNILDIEGSYLQNININDCPNLQHFFTQCPQLKRVSAENCQILVPELIGILIISGVEVVTNKFSCKEVFHKIHESQQNQLSKVYEDLVQDVYHWTCQNIASAEDYSLSIAFSKRGCGYFQTSEILTNISKIITLKDSLKIYKNVNEQLIFEITQLLLNNPNIRHLKFSNLCQNTVITHTLQTMIKVFEKNQNKIFKSDLKSISFLTNNNIIQPQDFQLIGQFIGNFPFKNKIQLDFTNFRNIGSIQHFNSLFKGLSLKLKIINYLDLSFTNLFDDLIEELSTFISLPEQQIFHLILTNCSITDNNMAILMTNGVKKNKSIRILDISNNEISGYSVPFTMQFATPDFNPQISQIIFDGNNLNGINFLDLSIFAQIKELSFKRSNLLLNDIQQISLYLQKNCQLTHLDLSNNSFTIEIIEELARAIAANTSLRDLKLKAIFSEQNSQNLQKIQLLTQGLSENQTISSLDLSSNNLKDAGLQIICETLIKNNNQLKKLNINDDKSFSCQQLKRFCQFLDQNTSLTLISLDEYQKSEDFEVQSIVKYLEYLSEKKSISQKQSFQRKQTKKNSNLSQFQSNSSSSNQQKNYEESKLNQNNFMRSNTFTEYDYYNMGLSIDGGGMRGIIPATIIQRLCQRTEREVWQMFDVVGGTSIGGIIALGSTGTLDGQQPIADHDEIVNIFQEHGTTIFNSSKFGGIWNNLWDKAKYDPVGIESVLMKYFQQSKLSDVMPGTNVLVTAVKRNTQKGKSKAKIFRSKDAIFNESKNFFMRDVARSTSAAPTFFTSSEIENINGTKQYSLIDGGVGQNNPAKLVLDEIQKEAINQGNEKNFFLISIGTGIIEGKDISSSAGLLNIPQIIDIFGDSMMDYVDKEIQQLHKSQFLRIKPIIPEVQRNKADLDSTDPKLISTYVKVASEVAEQVLEEQYLYGPFGDRNLVEWLQENTAKKKDQFI